MNRVCWEDVRGTSLPFLATGGSAQMRGSAAGGGAKPPDGAGRRFVRLCAGQFVP